MITGVPIADDTIRWISDNIQLIPELLPVGFALLTILLSSQPLLFITLGLIAVQSIIAGLNRIIIRMAPEAAVVSSTMSGCFSGPIAKSWSRLFGATPDLLWHPMTPSLYVATAAFLAAWGWALNVLYGDEINAGVVPKSMGVGFAVTGTLLLLLLMTFRWFQRCESGINIFGGLALGAALGFFGAIALGYATDRRATNIWGIPLLRDRINNGSAVYICPSTAS